MIVQDFPLTGIGMGLFGQVAAWLYPFGPAGPEMVPHAHNLYLQIAVDLGLPGLIAWLLAAVNVLKAGWTLFSDGNYRSETWQQALGAAVLSSLAALLIHGLMDSVTWGMVRPAPLVWGIWGIAAAGGAFARQNAGGASL
jgi:putative inorganic carbon (HCO3(-)) transporter